MTGRLAGGTALVLIAFAAQGLLAADLPLDVASDSTLVSRPFRSEDGAPTGAIFGLAQDRDGYLWVGGASGLVRFDGNQFIAWGAHGQPPLRHTDVRSLLADRDGGLWVGFNEGGVVSRLVDNQVLTYTTKDGLPEGVIYPTIQDRTGAVWAVGPGGIAVFRVNRWEQRQGRDGLPAGAAEAVYEDRSGRLWIAAAGGIFRRAAGETQFELVTRALASAFGEDRHGDLWLIHSQQGLRRLAQKSSGEPIPDAWGSVTGTDLIVDRQGHFWIGSPYRTGLLLVTAHSGRAHPTSRTLLDERNVLDTLVVSLLEDREGNIWVGTSNGLLRFSWPKVRLYSRGEGLPDDNVRTIEATPSGALWIGTGRGLATLTPKDTIELPAIDGIEGRAVTSLHTDHLGRLWIGFADSGLGMVANGRFSAIGTPGDAFPENVITVSPDRNGGLWVCNRRARGLYYLRGPQIFAKAKHIPEPGLEGCTTTLLERDGRMWIAFDDGRLLVREGNGAYRSTRIDGTAHSRVCAMYQDGQGSIWFATTGGLSRYRGDKFSTISTRNGLPTNYITGVIEDLGGNLWASANAGILHLTKAEFERTVSDPAHRVQYTFYDSSDGIRDTPVCYGEPHASRDRRGRLWFTSLSGAVVIDPSVLREEPAAPAPLIERMIADGAVLTGRNISLPAHTATVELQYTAVRLSAASKIRFQYRLRGFDASWIDAGNRRQAFYTNLAPGHYQFEVRASLNRQGAAPSTVYDFEVRPAFYQTYSFYAGVAALAAIALWGAWQLRVRALHRRYALIMEERARIGREIHDTVLQSMAGVALQIEAVARQHAPTRGQGAALYDSLARISNKIKEHVAEARQSIWDLRTPQDAANLEVALRDLGERATDGTGIRFDLAVFGPPRACGRDVERELIRMAGEALRNAVQHSSATLIRLELHYTDDALRLVIRDDGRGFSVEEHLAAGRNHWGLVGMRERASRINAQFNIKSEAGVGTAVEMAVPYAAPAN